jgi:hypothetical protein
LPENCDIIIIYINLSMGFIYMQDSHIFAT